MTTMLCRMNVMNDTPHQLYRNASNRYQILMTLRPVSPASHCRSKMTAHTSRSMLHRWPECILEGTSGRTRQRTPPGQGGGWPRHQENAAKLPYGVVRSSSPDTVEVIRSR